MKELESKKGEQIEIVAEQQQRKEIKMIGQQRKIVGLTLWEHNHETNELRPANFTKIDLEVNGLSASPESITCRNRVIVNENCTYFQALNRKNALKKLGLG